MTIEEGREWVWEHGDDDLLDDVDLHIVFTALYGRSPNRGDIEDGIWSLCCAALPIEY